MSLTRNSVSINFLTGEGPKNYQDCDKNSRPSLTRATVWLPSLSNFAFIHSTSSVFSPDSLNNAWLNADALGSDVQLH